MTLTGQHMLGQPVMIKSSEHEKNLAWEAQEAAKQNQAAAANLLAGGWLLAVGCWLAAVACVAAGCRMGRARGVILT